MLCEIVSQKENDAPQMLWDQFQKINKEETGLKKAFPSILLRTVLDKQLLNNNW